MYSVILFYKYVSIRYPVQIKKWQRRLCEQLGLRGRVIVAHEGINATLGATLDSINAYVMAMKEHELFGDIDFKVGRGTGEDFPRLSVLVKSEIVRLGIDPQVLSAEEGGRHLTPEETHTLLDHKPDNLVILDARNAYESAIGYFEGAVKPAISSFRELPQYLDQHIEQFRNKVVVMYCTGGVRCERASAYLKKKQVAREVMQLSGGIHRYVAAYPQGFFKGKNYVFDGRGAVQVTDDILGKCVACRQPCDRYSACTTPTCRQQLIVCALADARHAHPRCGTCLS